MSRPIHHIPPPELRPIIRIIFAMESVGALLPQVLFQGGLISLFVLFLGGAEFEVGIVNALINVSLMGGLFIVPYLEVRPGRQLLFIWYFVCMISLFLLPLAIPLKFLYGPGLAIAFLAFVVLVNRSTHSMTSSIWMPYVVSFIPSAVRGRFFGRYRVAWRLASFFGLLAAGWLLGRQPTAQRYYMLFAIGLVLYIPRTFLVKKLPDTPPRRTGEPEPLWTVLKTTLADLKFRQFLLFLALTFGVVAAGHPFVVPFMKLELQFPSSVIVYALSGLAIGSILTLVGWGKLADRWGNRFVFFSSLAVIGFSLLLFILTPSYVSSPVAAFILATLGFTIRGIGVSGLGIAYTVRLMYQAQGGLSGAYMTVSRMAVGIASGAAPVLMGFLLKILPDSVVLFGGSVLTKRVFFFSIFVLSLSTLFLVRGLHRIEEKGIREILSRMRRKR